LRKVLRAMMKHAVEAGLRADDPTRDVRAIRVKSDGFHSWSDVEIEQFEARHEIGSRATDQFDSNVISPPVVDGARPQTNAP
jgi:hypothetical protein